VRRVIKENPSAPRDQNQSLKGGTIQVCVSKPQSNSNPVLRYTSLGKARQVLLGLGIDETEIEDNFEIAF